MFSSLHFILSVLYSFSMNDRFIEDLKSRVDIVEIVKRYAQLKKSGKNYMCRSPFRNEKTPSFCVSPDKQFWYDFGNSEGGDVISFLERAENMSFLESVEMLADMAGVEVPKQAYAEKGPNKQEKQDIISLHNVATEYFQEQLRESQEALLYLESRGITEQMIKDWSLGYGGDTKDGLAKYLLSNGFSEEMIAQSGVAFEREFGDQKMMDRFWGRVMIPIREPRNGDIIAFSGRDILNREKVGKYVNSPENPVYHKSSTLFGYDKARKILREKDHIILVEGNLDVMFAHNLGYANTVATCGTSLTEDHIRFLKRQTDNFVLAFDSDLAGKKATLRGVDMCLKAGVTPWIIQLTAGKDFADLAVADEKALRKSIEGKTNALEFLFEAFAKKNLDGSLEGEKKFLDSFFTFLRLSQRPIEVDHYIEKIAQHLKRQKAVVEAEFHRFMHSHKAPKPLKKDRVEGNVFKPSRTDIILGLVLIDWDYFATYVTPEVFEVFNTNQQAIVQNKKEGKTFTNDQKQYVSGVHMYIENTYGECEREVLEKDIQKLLQEIQKESKANRLMKEAEALRKQLSGE